jgi:hypothetical protein
MRLNALIDILADIAGKPFDYPTQIKARDFIITARAALIRQQYEKTKTFPTSALISTCIDLVEKNSVECCGIDLGCKVVVSKNELPLPIDVKDAVIFEYVGDITGTKAYGYIKPGEVPYIKYRKFSSNLVYYTWINRRLLFFNKPALEKARVRYVPSNPVEAASLMNCDGTASCIDLESEAFIEDHWEDAITKMVLPKIMPQKERQVHVDENAGN